MTENQDKTAQLRHASTEQLLHARSELMTQLHEGSRQGLGMQIGAGLLNGAAAGAAIAAIQWLGRRVGIMKHGVFSDRLGREALAFGTFFSVIGFFRERGRQQTYAHFDQVNAIDTVLNERQVMAQTVTTPKGGQQNIYMTDVGQTVSDAHHKGLIDSAVDLAQGTKR